MKAITYLILPILLIACNQKAGDRSSYYYSRLSDSLLRSGDLEGAEVAIKKALDLDDKNFVAYNNLGILNMKLDKPEEEVLAPFLQSVSIKSDYLVAINNLANYYFSKKKYPEAVGYSTTYIDIANHTDQPKDSIGHIYAIRGESQIYLKQYDDAINDLKTALSLDHNSASTYKELGSAYRNLGRYEEAIQNYSKAIELDHNYAQAYDGLAICYDDGFKDYKKALENYDKAIAINPNSGTYYYNRGSLLYDYGFKEKAYPDLVKADSLGKAEAKSYLIRYEKTP